MFLFQVTNAEQASPIAKLNLYNTDLEKNIFAWRSHPSKDNLTLLIKLTFNAMSAAQGILNPKSKDKAPESSPQYQLALRTMRLAKRTIEELNSKGFSDEAYTYPNGSVISVAGAVAFFTVDAVKGPGPLAYTNDIQNAAYQDMYFKNYFAVLFSPSFKDADNMSVIRLANALTDAAYVRSATIKMPFSNEKDAQAFADFAKSGGIPYCKVTSSPEISDAGFANQKMVIFSISYDGNYLPAEGASKARLPSIPDIKQYTVAPLPKSEYSRTGLVYGDAPTLDQLKERDNPSSSQQKRTPYSFFAEYQYAEKFNEANIESIASAKDAFLGFINDYMQYMGVSLSNYTPPDLTTFFGAPDGKGRDFLIEFKQMFESGKFIGSATVESRKQVADNEKLGGKRKELFQKVANDVLTECGVNDKSLLLSLPADKTNQAVSVWDKPDEVVKSWVDRLTALTSDPQRAEYAKLALAILSGDYEEAKKLNSDLKVFDPGFFASISKQKAALVRNEDGTYGVGNADLLEKLLGRCDNGVGLRYEGTLSDGTKKGVPKSTNRQRFGAFFVDAVLEPDRGVRVTTKDMNTKVKVDVSSPVRVGEKVTADITVFVNINDKDRLFLENSANRLDVSGRAADGSTLKYEAISEPAQVEVEVEENGKKVTKKAMRYTVTFNTKDVLYVQANAHKGDLEFGWAWAGAKAEERKYATSYPQVAGLPTKGSVNGRYNKIPFIAYYDDEQGKRQKVDVRIAFSARDANDKAIGYIAPGKSAVKKQFCYTVSQPGGSAEIAIYRDIVFGDKSHTKDELIGLAKEGVVGFAVGAAGLKEPMWIALDGTTELAKDASLSESNGTITSSVKKSGMRDVVTHEGLETGQVPGKPMAASRAQHLIPYYTILPDQPVQFGTPGKDNPPITPREVRRLARECYTAIVRPETEVVGGEEVPVPTIFDLSGKRLGTTAQAGEPAPTVNGIFVWYPAAQQKTDVNFRFTYPDVYGPSDASAIVGVIQPRRQYIRRQVQ